MNLTDESVWCRYPLASLTGQITCTHASCIQKDRRRQFRRANPAPPPKSRRFA